MILKDITYYLIILLKNIYKQKLIILMIQNIYDSIRHHI